jgi:hypothetical protein
MPAATLPRILKYGKVVTPHHRDSGSGDIFALIGIAAGAMVDAGGELLFAYLEAPDVKGLSVVTGLRIARALAFAPNARTEAMTPLARSGGPPRILKQKTALPIGLDEQRELRRAARHLHRPLRAEILGVEL